MDGLRVNTLRTDSTAVIDQLQAAGLQPSRLPWCSEGVLVTDKQHAVVAALSSEGNVYIQNPSSLIPTVVLDPQPGETILDMTAAPGGKTMHIAARMENSGRVLANDVSKARVIKMQQLFNQYGVTNVQTNVFKGEFLWRKYSDSFDAVLVDAPCSMNLERSAKELKALAKQQTFLLRSALACVRSGGRVVYSTCTSRAEENEAVVDWIVNHVEGVAVVPIQIDGLPAEFMTPEGYVRVADQAPYHAFFVAQLRRV